MYRRELEEMQQEEREIAPDKEVERIINGKQYNEY